MTPSYADVHVPEITAHRSPVCAGVVEDAISACRRASQPSRSTSFHVGNRSRRYPAGGGPSSILSGARTDFGSSPSVGSTTPAGAIDDDDVVPVGSRPASVVGAGGTVSATSDDVA